MQGKRELKEAERKDRRLEMGGRIEGGPVLLTRAGTERPREQSTCYHVPSKKHLEVVFFSKVTLPLAWSFL